MATLHKFPDYMRRVGYVEFLNKERSLMTVVRWAKPAPAMPHRNNVVQFRTRGA